MNGRLVASIIAIGVAAGIAGLFLSLEDKAPTKPAIQQTVNPGKVAIAGAKPSSGVGPLGLEIRGEGSTQVSKLFDQLKRMTRVQTGKMPDLIWDLSDAKITTPSGKVVAVLADQDVPTVQRIVDQWTLLNALDRLTIGRKFGLELLFLPKRPFHSAGEKVEIALRGHKFGYVVLFNLAPDGSINLIYPQKADFDRSGASWPTLPLKLPFSFETDVSPPFGLPITSYVLATKKNRASYIIPTAVIIDLCAPNLSIRWT